MTPRNEQDPQTSGEPASSGPPYRAIAMVLLTLVVIAVAVGLVQLFGTKDDLSTPAATPVTSSSSAPSPQAPAPEASPASQQEGQNPAPAQPTAPAQGAPQVDPASVPVRVYNNSTVAGLAGRTGDQIRGAGFTVAGITNMPSNQGVVPHSVVYYGGNAGEQQAAENVAARLGIQAEPRPADFRDTEPGVIVIVTQDLQR